MGKEMKIELDISTLEEIQYLLGEIVDCPARRRIFRALNEAISKSKENENEYSDNRGFREHSNNIH
jgi:hypothetical protein